MTIEKSSKGVYKDFEDFFKTIVSELNIKDKIGFRKDLTNLIKTFDFKENNYDLYSFIFVDLLKKYGGKNDGTRAT